VTGVEGRLPLTVPLPRYLDKTRRILYSSKAFFEFVAHVVSTPVRRKKHWFFTEPVDKKNGLLYNRKPSRTRTTPSNGNECDRMYGPLAQLVEQQTLNLWVEGSIPSWLKEKSRLRIFSTLDTRSASDIAVRARVVELADTPDLGSGAPA
jgi:hypothetical protein